MLTPKSLYVDTPPPNPKSRKIHCHLNPPKTVPHIFLERHNTAGTNNDALSNSRTGGECCLPRSTVGSHENEDERVRRAEGDVRRPVVIRHYAAALISAK